MNNQLQLLKAICFFILVLFSYTSKSEEINELAKLNPINIKCSLSADSPQNLNNGVRVSFKIQPDQTIRLLTWQTPLEGIMGDLFKVLDSAGKELLYEGPMIKRGAPTDIDYLTIKQNEYQENEVDLSLVYSFKQDEDYQITLRKLVLNLIDENLNQPLSYCSSTNKVSVRVK